MNIKTICSFTLALLFSSLVNAQCDDPDFIDGCGQQLKGYTLLKSYKVDSKDLKNGKAVQYSYIFSKNTTYYLSVCSSDQSSKMIVNLYDKSKRILATNYDKRTKKHYPALIYRCTSTGSYYLTFEFANHSGCGVGVLGFIK